VTTYYTYPQVTRYGAFATADGALVLISIQNERERAGILWQSARLQN
jgi:crotonobetainyl-CoA:carnitine CoA-transferase CaiB-like acyl-CoA transferase